MNIELTYSEAVEIKVALSDVIRANEECLKDESFKEQYPACWYSLQEQLKRCQSIKQKLQTELDKI